MNYKGLSDPSIISEPNSMPPAERISVKRWSGIDSSNRTQSHKQGFLDDQVQRGLIARKTLAVFLFVEGLEHR